MAIKMLHIWSNILFAEDFFLIGRFSSGFHQNWIILPRSFWCWCFKTRKINIFAVNAGKLRNFTIFKHIASQKFHFSFKSLTFVNLSKEVSREAHGKHFDFLNVEFGRILRKIWHILSGVSLTNSFKKSSLIFLLVFFCFLPWHFF